METHEQIEWLGTTAAAKRLGITTRTLYRMIDLGHIVAFRMGRVIRVKGSDIEKYIESCQIEPGTISNLYPTPEPKNPRHTAPTHAEGFVAADSEDADDLDFDDGGEDFDH